MNAVDVVLTIATGDPLSVVTATPPTVARAAKSETFSVPLKLVDEVTPSLIPAHAASAAAAAA